MALVYRIFTVIFFSLSISCFAQGEYRLTIHYYSDSVRHTRLLPEKEILIDSTQLARVIGSELAQIYDMGYLAANARVIHAQTAQGKLLIYANQQYRWAYLSQGNVSDGLLRKVGFDPGHFDGKPFAYPRIARILNELVAYAENNGHPFASARLDSLNISGGNISAWINYQPGPLIEFDSLVVEGFDKVKPKFLMDHLGIYQGKPYDERLVKSIGQRMRLLPFLTLSAKPEIDMSNGKCTIRLQLEQKSVSTFDGILGVLPNEKAGQQMLITGQLMLDLYNVFASGKRIALDWQSYDASSQLLNALYYHPNIFHTPLNVQPDFYLLKQDTTFINRKFAIDISVLTRRSEKIAFRTEWISSNLISTAGLEDMEELPTNADYRLNYYGMSYGLDKLNIKNLPTGGFDLSLNASVGQKKIIENPALNPILYAGVRQQSLQFRLSGELDTYWHLYKTWYCATKCMADI